MEEISIREFARRLGCSEALVRKSINQGKIVEGVHTPAGSNWPRIKVDIALKEWAKYYDPTTPKNSKLNKVLAEGDALIETDPPKVGRPKKGEEKPKPPKPPKEEEYVPPPPPGQPGGKSTAELNRLKAEVALQMEAIKLRQMKGQLVDKDKVYKTLFEIGQRVRTAIMTVPDKHIDEIITAPSRNEAHTILVRVLTEALETLTATDNPNLT